ncbi:MAG TPA: phage major capsid protein [Kofleriaceae bacterium]
MPAVARALLFERIAGGGMAMTAFGFEIRQDGTLRRTGTVEQFNIKQARQANADAIKAMQSIHDAIRDDRRVMSDVERTTFQALKDYSEDVSAVLKRRELEADEERQCPAVTDPDADAAARALARAGVTIDQSVTEHQGRVRPGKRSYAELFPKAARTMDGWSSGSEFLAVVGHGIHDPRLRIAAATMTGDDAPGGGYAVPSQLVAAWLDASLEDEIIRPKATVWPMVTRERTVPAVDISDRSGGDVAGLSIQWAAEGGEMDLQTAKIRKIKLVAKKGSILAEASNELLADGIGYDAQLTGVFQTALSFGLDKSFLWGIGGGQPLGAFSSGAMIDTDKQAGQDNRTIVYENLVAMQARMAPANFARSVWLAHPSTIPQLSTLVVTAGTGGSHIPVMTTQSGQFVILTRPVIFTEKMKPLGQRGDIGLFDFSEYVIGLRRDVAIDRSMHVGFSRDVMTFRLTIRIDGQPNIQAPYQLPDNADSVSPFVTLEARS